MSKTNSIYNILYIDINRIPFSHFIIHNISHFGQWLTCPTKDISPINIKYYHKLQMCKAPFVHVQHTCILHRISNHTTSYIQIFCCSVYNTDKQTKHIIFIVTQCTTLTGTARTHTQVLVLSIQHLQAQHLTVNGFGQRLTGNLCSTYGFGWRVHRKPLPVTSVF